MKNKDGQIPISFATKVKNVNKVLTLVEIRAPFNIEPYLQIEAVKYYEFMKFLITNSA